MQKKTMAFTGALLSVAVSIASAMGVTIHKTDQQTITVDHKEDPRKAREFKRKMQKAGKELQTYGKLRAPSAPITWNQRKARKLKRQQPHGRV